MSTIHRLYDLVGRRARSRRWRWLSNEFDIADMRALDIGGTSGSWQLAPRTPRSLTIVNLRTVDGPGDAQQLVVADACDLPFPPGTFDLAYSNSCIEHVGSATQQQAFADEARSVAGALWIQTPARSCPIEPHYLAPFVHWLPRPIQRRTIRWATPWGLITKPSQQQIDDMVSSTRILSRREFARLFPDCNIRTERLAGVIPKSYIAIRAFTPAPSDQDTPSGKV
jgi:hypothetical protein